MALGRSDRGRGICRNKSNSLYSHLVTTHSRNRTVSSKLPTYTPGHLLNLQCGWLCSFQEVLRILPSVTMFAPAALPQKNVTKGCPTWMLGPGCDFSLLRWTASRIQTYCGTDLFTSAPGQQCFFKLFTANDVDWCRIGLNCQVALAQLGQTWRKELAKHGCIFGRFRSCSHIKPSKFGSLPPVGMHTAWNPARISFAGVNRGGPRNCSPCHSASHLGCPIFHLHLKNV